MAKARKTSTKVRTYTVGDKVRPSAFFDNPKRPAVGTITHITDLPRVERQVCTVLWVGDDKLPTKFLNSNLLKGHS